MNRKSEPMFRATKRPDRAKQQAFAKLLALLLTLTVCNDTFAQTLTWTGAADGASFGLAGNWSPAVTPGATHDCVVPAGAGTINVTTGVAVRSITTARNFLVGTCAGVVVTAGLELQSGAVFQINNAVDCAGILFSGGTQTLSGSGKVLISSAGNNGVALGLHPSTNLTIDASISIEYGPGATGSAAAISLSTGATLTNNGTIAIRDAGRTLGFSGGGTLINNGTLHAYAGTLSIKPLAWTNAGQIILDPWSDLLLIGNFTSLGTILNNGGNISVTAALSNVTLVAGPDSGNITLKASSFTNCTFQTSGTAEFILDGVCSFTACTLSGSVSLGNCALMNIQGGLHLENDAVLADNAAITGGPRCLGTPINFVGGTQAVTGNGQIRLRYNPPTTDSGYAMAFKQNASVTVGAGVTIVAPNADPSTNILVESGSSLINDGTLSIGARGFALELAPPSAQFINNGAIDLLPASTAQITGSGWTNAGTISCADSSSLTISGSWTNSGTLSSLGATINMSGDTWANSGSATFTSSNTTLNHTSWTNPGQIHASGGTLAFKGDWTNAGLVTSTNCALSLGGTFSSLGSLTRSGGTVTLNQATYSGSTLVANSSTGDLVLNLVDLVNTTLSVNGAQFIVQFPTFVNSTLTFDITVAPGRKIGIAGNLTLANANITLGANPNNGNTNPITFVGGSNSITGNGTILVLNAPTVFDQISSANVTIGSGVTLALGPGAFNNTTANLKNLNASNLINQGTVAVRQAGCTLTNSGAGIFQNQGTLEASAGTMNLINVTGNLGHVTVAPGATLKITGNFTVDQPIDCAGSLTLDGTWTNNADITSSGGSVTLSGSWTNNADITVTGGSLALNGTWSNAGSFNLVSSNWTIGGTASSLGTHTTTQSTLTYAGTYSGTLITADASTGDVYIAAAQFTNALLLCSDGAVFRTAPSPFATFDGCSLDGTLIFGACGQITLRNGLTLLNNARISIQTTSCGGPLFSSPAGAQSISGTGDIQFNPGTNAVLFGGPPARTLSIAPGITIFFDSASSSSTATITNSAGTIINSGLISARKPGASLVFGSGTFQNLGTVEVTAGTFTINPTTLSNYDPATFKLTGGRWIARNGSLSLGSRPIRIIAADTEIAVAGQGFTTPNLSALSSILGTLRIANTTVASGPISGTLTHSGFLDLAKDGFLDVFGHVTLTPDATVQTEIAGLNTNQFGRIKSAAQATVAGHLRGKFSPPYTPVIGNLIAPFIAASTSISGAFSDVCFDDNPQHLGVSQSLVGLQLRLTVSAASGIAPAISQQPANAHPTPDAVFHVDAAPGDVTYQWRKGQAPLTDGPTPWGSFISGAGTATLTIQSPRAQDADAYDVLITNTCGSSTSTSALLILCSGDLNYDNLVDDADFQIFASAYNILDCNEPAMPLGCPADLNSDGLVDDADFILFVPAYDALLCP